MIYETVQEWAQCREALLAAIETCGGTHTEDDVLRMILTGQLTLFRENASGLVAEIQVYPRMKVAHAFLVGGRLTDIAALEQKLIEFGHKNGCSRMTCSGRHGWGKVLPGYGWESVTTFLQKDI